MPLDVEFVDEHADGLDLPLRAMGRNAHRIGSVEEFVDDVLLALMPGDCIRRLRLIGHGSEGSINVGSGRRRDPSGRKTISIRNTKHWVDQLARLRCKFCEDGEFELVGCNTGAGMLGARLLTLIVNTIVCCKAKAPVEPISALLEPLTRWQEVDRIEEGRQRARFPDVIDPDRLKTSLLWPGTGNGPLVGGAALASMAHYDPATIVGARIFPASQRGPAISGVAPVGAKLLRSVVHSFVNPRVASAPFALFAIDGYLQLNVRSSTKRTKWISAGAVLGDCAYYSPFGLDTTLVYEFSTAARTGLARQFGR